jgi:hypothetical protein
MKRMNKYLVAILFFSLCLSIKNYGQERLSSLASNPALSVAHVKSAKMRLEAESMLNLPFFDDFAKSSTYPYPDPSKWEDNAAYVNTNYSNNPISIGVATLDALDGTGHLYTRAVDPTFLADSLTSRPINIGNVSDSVYLSFFYQPAGLGEPPETNDSLILQFWAPLQNRWITQWAAPGDTSVPFKLAMLPIVDTAYFHPGFKFRFRNYASLNIFSNDPGRNSNGDIWNLDYIKLDSARNSGDTIFHDLAFIKPMASPLRNYESLPWNHFILTSVYGNEMGGKLNLQVRNIDTVTRNCQRSYKIFDVYGKLSYSPLPPEADSVAAGKLKFFSDDLSEPLLDDQLQDSALFIIQAALDNTYQFEEHDNDTTVYYQRFKNYYAYDDGSAEYGYGLSGEGVSSASIALKFKTYKPDTLQAIDIYFNDTIPSPTTDFLYNRKFYPSVWGNNKGKPGNLLYNQNGTKLKWPGHIGWNRFFLDTSIMVKDTFYIGLVQSTSYFLNIGFDINRNSTSKLFYNLEGTAEGWLNSKKVGALMIRPILGAKKDALLPVGINTATINNFHVYPNPATDNLHLAFPETWSDQKKNILVYDISGKVLMNKELNNSSIDISSFQQGIYIIKLVVNGDKVFNTKFIKIAH